MTDDDQPLTEAEQIALHAALFDRNVDPFAVFRASENIDVIGDDPMTIILEDHQLTPCEANIWHSSTDGDTRYWFVSPCGSHEGPDGTLYAYWRTLKAARFAVSEIASDPYWRTLEAVRERGGE